MNSIRVLKAGLLTTVQDLGRQGFGPIGVSASGAADPIALRLGNCLVGNAENAAALEMTLLGGTFVFEKDGTAALTGSDFGAIIDGVPAPIGASFEIRSGQTLRLAPTRSGARCYLCIHGGINVPAFLGSASTHLLSGLGGFEGRALRDGDVLQIGPATERFRQRRTASRVSELLAPRKTLRVTHAPQAHWFSGSSRRSFYSATYHIGEQSDRMGLRLEGPAIRPARHRAMITEGVSLGAIQVPAGGCLIILFVEQQTTGGYPKIANVISADLHRLAQLRPRDEIRFELVSWRAARSALIEQEKLMSPAAAIVE